MTRREYRITEVQTVYNFYYLTAENEEEAWEVHWRGEDDASDVEYGDVIDSSIEDLGEDLGVVPGDPEITMVTSDLELGE